MDSINLREIKKARLEKHWSQEQLAEMSGLSVRTIQRIEKGENAGLESLKALAAVFEVKIIDSDKKEEIAKIKKEKKYFKKIKGFYKLVAVAALSLSSILILAIVNPEMWMVMFYFAITWAIILGINGYETFVFLRGEDKEE